MVEDNLHQPPGYNFVHGPEVLVWKHTGCQIERSDLEACRTGHDVLRIVHQLTGVEYLLQKARQDMLDLAEKIRHNIEAVPGEDVEEFFPDGEVSNSKIVQIDHLLGQRATAIKELRLIVTNMLTDDPRLRERVNRSRINGGQEHKDAA